MSAALAVVTAYLVGAVPVGYLIARAFGVADIRHHGSGTIGATNVLRAAGRLPAALTLGADVVKGFLAVWLAARAGGDPALAAAAAVAAVVGNCWPVFLAFRGGKGVATGLGACLALVPLAVAPAAAVWLGMTAASRYVSLGSLLAAVTVPAAALLLAYPAAAVAATAAVAAIVIARHHENIARLRAGTERRVGAHER